MKHFNHYIIAGSTCYLFNPPMIPIALIGGVAPDYIEYIVNGLNLTRQKIKHRTITHIFSHWLILALFAAFIFDFHNVLFWFAIGGLSHVMSDSLSPSGIPLTPFSTNRSSFFGGKVLLGTPLEYGLAGVYMVLCALAAHAIHVNSEFFPFFFNWAQEYQNGYIDAFEWKTNRLRIF